MKRLKRLLVCRNKGGFTLSEMIISCALLGILMLGIVMFISPILDTVTSTNAGTRAANAAETVEYYISRSIRNAAYIAVLTDTNFTDVQTQASDIITELNGKTDSNYKLKCISIRYVKDEKSQTNKYFICNETVETSGSLKTNTTPSADTMVFDPCYFDGIYPKVTISRVQQEQSDGTKKNMPAVQIDVEIYDDANMAQMDRVFSGTGYTVLRNIELSQQDTSLKQPFKIIEPLPKSLSSGDPADKSKEMETYIFYVERTLATAPTPTP